MNAKKKSDAIKQDPEIIDLGPEAIVDRDDDMKIDEPAAAFEPPHTETPFEQAAEPSYAAPASRGKRNWVWPLAALLIGTGLGGWLYRDLLSGYFPTPQMSALEQRIAGLEQSSATAGERTTAQDRLLEQLKTDIDELEAQQAGSAGENQKIADDIAALGNRVAASGSHVDVLQKELQDMKSVAAAITAADGATVEPSSIAPLLMRIEALEKEVAGLKAERSSTPDTSALSQSLSDLKAKIAAGVAFKDEADRIARMVPAAPGLDILTVHAESGLPNAAQLAQHLRGMKAALPVPETPRTDEQGYWSKVAGFFDGIIKVKTIAETNWQDAAEKAAVFAESNNLAGAVQLLEASEGETPATLVTWLEQAKQRTMLEDALTATSDAVARQLAAKG